jgi:hypothetical protein
MATVERWNQSSARPSAPSQAKREFEVPTRRPILLRTGGRQPPSRVDLLQARSSAPAQPSAMAIASRNSNRRPIASGDAATMLVDQRGEPQVLKDLTFRELLPKSHVVGEPVGV